MKYFSVFNSETGKWEVISTDEIGGGSIVDVEAALAELIGGEENTEVGEVEGSGSE